MAERAAIQGFRIEPLDKRHDRAAFFCGSEELDRYFRTIARQDVVNFVAAIYVATRDSRTVAGFYSLSQYSINLSLLPEPYRADLPKYPHVPVTLLGRLAIHRDFQGIGLGALLLADALKRALAVSSLVGSAMVVVDAKDEVARRFYEAHGFQRLPEFPNRLVMAMRTIEVITQE